MWGLLGYPAEEKKASSTEEEDKLAGDDDFKDAFEDEVDNGKTFEVTDDELKTLRTGLEEKFPEDYTYLSDAYILSVASKPYSKDPENRRPLEYTLEKLINMMEWRANEGAPGLHDLVKLGNGPADAEEAVENPEKLEKAQKLVTALNYSGMYFHGMTKDGRPVLWLRTNRMPWYPDVDAQCGALIVLVDAAMKSMPEGITDFICVADSAYPPPPNPAYLIKVLKALVKGYPDRMHNLYSAPVSSVIQFVMNLLLPLMPGRLAKKINLLGLDEVKVKLTELLMHGEEDIPTFFGGPSEHDKLYPEEYYAENRGEGTLKFDYFGMIERLEQSKAEFEQSKE